jgi:hypothetical protein
MDEEYMVLRFARLTDVVCCGCSGAVVLKVREGLGVFG